MLVCIGLKLDLSYWWNNIDWGCLVMECQAEYLVIRERSDERLGKMCNCVLSNPLPSVTVKIQSWTARCMWHIASIEDFKLHTEWSENVEWRYSLEDQSIDGRRILIGVLKKYTNKRCSLDWFGLTGKSGRLLCHNYKPLGTMKDIWFLKYWSDSQEALTAPWK